MKGQASKGKQKSWGGPPNQEKPSNQPRKQARFSADGEEAAYSAPADEDFDAAGEGYFERVETVEGEDNTFDLRQGKWIRARSEIDPRTQPITFHWLDIDMIAGSPMPSNPAGGRVIGSTDVHVPIIRLFGVTQDGHSVMASVHGYTPYFYATFSGVTDLSEETLGAVRAAMDTRVRSLSILLSFLTHITFMCSSKRKLEVTRKTSNRLF